MVYQEIIPKLIPIKLQTPEKQNQVEHIILIVKKVRGGIIRVAKIRTVGTVLQQSNIRGIGTFVVIENRWRLRLGIHWSRRT